MDLASRYRALAQGALLVAESAEDAYPLAALDPFLGPWIRERLHSLAGLLDSCDTRRQLAEDTRAIARTAADYSALREQLFSDLHHTGPEPQWRTVQRGTLAIRAQSGVLLDQPTFVLRRLAAGSDVPGAETWDFTVIERPGEPARTFVVMVATGDRTRSLPVQVAKELEDERAWYQQLDYGFRALGINPFLTAIYDPDRHRKRPTHDAQPD